MKLLAGSKFVYGLPLLLCAWILIACGVRPPAELDHERSEARERIYSGEYPIQIVTTTAIVGDLVTQIGGKHVQVTALMGEGVDPHLYKATPGDLSKLKHAAIIFYSGLHLEAKLAEVLERLAEHQPTFAVSEKLDRNHLRHPPEFEGNYDPHVWFDSALWAQCGEAVRDTLMRFDPAHAADYKVWGDAHLAEIRALDADTKVQIATIPPERRLLITAHDAFGYFGDRYGIEVMAIQGISTESEAGVRHVNEMVDNLVQRQVKAVFVESSVSDKNIKALLEGCASRGHTITIGGSLFSDAMGATGTPEGTYLGMVRHNVRTIVDALR